MDKNEIVSVPQAGFLAPAVGVQDALNAYQAKKDLIDNIMKEKVDFGTIPGTDKPTLYKAGAEKATSFFGLHPVFTDAEVVNDWTGENHGGEPFFFYRRTCSLYRGDTLVASVDGSCNSWEKKYRFRSAERKCPSCGKTTIIKGKAEYGGGWLCWTRKGGCGTKFTEQDPAIAGQSLEQVANPDIADVVNTVLKMADKRALVAAVLIACGLSEYFTQDVDDFVVADSVIVDVVEKKSPTAYVVTTTVAPPVSIPIQTAIPPQPEEPPVEQPVQKPAVTPAQFAGAAKHPDIARVKADWVNAAVTKGILKDTKNSAGANRLIALLGTSYSTLNPDNAEGNRIAGLKAIADWSPS